MSRPYYQDDLVTLHHGDCLEVLAQLPTASVDAVVCDPPYGLDAVYVGRPTKWGNPFQVVREGGFWTVVDNNGVDYREPTTGWADKDYAVAKAVSLFAMDVQLGLAPYPIDEIRGKDLACFCPLDRPCHADVLLYMANRGDA